MKELKSLCKHLFALILTFGLYKIFTHYHKIAFDMAERIRADYLKKHPMPLEDTMERICLSELAQELADECVLHHLICG